VMVALFLSWLAIFHSSRALGARLTSGLFEEQAEWFPAFWTGLLMLSSVALAISCFTPLTPWIAFVLLFPPIVVWRKAPPAPWFFWIVLAAMTYTSSSAERLYDTALYHRQLIEWMARDGLVPGLAILHYRLGFSSSWLVWPALFDHGPLHARMGSAATGLALASIVAYWIQCSGRCRTLADRFYLVTAPLLCGYLLIESMIVSPSPNLGAACAVFIVLWMLLVPNAASLALIMAGAAATVKLSAAILMPVCLWRTRRMLAPAILLSLPLLLANLRTTGCPLFPSPVLCSEEPTGVGKEVARHVEQVAQNWARFVGEYPADAGFWSVDWFPRWISFPRKQLELGIALGTLLWFALRREWDACIAGAAAGFVYIFALAPDFRFGAGFLLALPGRALAGIPFRWPRVPQAAQVAAAVVALTVGARTGEHLEGVIARRWGDPLGLYPGQRLAWTADRLLRPVLAWSPERPRHEVRNGISILTPEPGTDRCGAVPRPCAPTDAMMPDIVLCDASSGLRGGFCRSR
jgi:hypothetical protein